ncbi:MAG: hypothetical protein E7510_09425 [Ruminococcus sp.]|nr:hypothetical protein [Ruminococcus sp.]
MIELKEKKINEDSEVDVRVLLKRYREFYEIYINDENIYAILTSKNKKKKMELINRADVLFHIACVSLNAGYIRRSLKFFLAFQNICQELQSQNV